MDDNQKVAQLVRTAIPARMKALERAGISFEPTADNGFSVAGGAFVFYPVSGTWRSSDHRERGYTIESLVLAIREAELRALIPRSAREPATGRDSAAPRPMDPDRSVAPGQMGVGAESVAGDRLKVIWP